MSGPFVRGTTRVFVHVGTPITHAKAPGLFNAEFERRGLDAVLVPMEVRPAHLSAMLSVLAETANVGGALVTMPHKAAIVDLCDGVGREARFVGAANAIRFEAGRGSTCEMFDGVGLVGALERVGVALSGVDVLLVGCGGAGSAIAAALVDCPIRSLSLHNRTLDVATALADRLSVRRSEVRVLSDLPSARGFGLVVNATRVGMADEDPESIDLAGAADCVVADIVTGPQRSRLLRQADALGLRTVDGADMLGAQMSSIIDFWFDAE